MEIEYTTNMGKAPILPLSNMRLINLATYLAVVVIAVLGAGSLTSLPARLAFALICLAFALVYAVAVRLKDFARWAHGYFVVQTILFVGLIAVRAPSGAFTFLLFLLAIHATTVFPGRIAAGWVGLFYLLAGFTDFLMNDPENAIGSIIFNIAVFLLASMIGHSTRQAELAQRANRQLIKELQAAQLQLSDLAVAEERYRLAREIHDGLGHYLTATTMQIQGARALLENGEAAGRSPAIASALNKAETLLQEALADVRRSVTALRATPAGNRPLAAAIGDLVAECRAIAGLEAIFELLGTPRPLNPQLELTLYRVAQEGLTNVRKYARASQVKVTLGFDPDKVTLNICDNGQGSSDPGGGFGLLGLRERVQLAGGTVDIVTAPDQGFQLKVEIPA